jgi:hypothetical protein
VDDFFSAESFGKLTVCVFVVVLIANTVRHFAGWGPRWAIFALALGVSAYAFSIAHRAEDSTLPDLSLFEQVFLWFANGCLIYTSAFGLQNTVISVPDTKPATKAPTGSAEAAPPLARSRWRSAW